MSVRIDDLAELDVPVLLDIADGRRLELGAGLLEQVQANRDAALRLLRSTGRVYGVNTGMGAASEIRLDEQAEARHQDNLMRGRAVGSAPWLTHREARAALAFRLRSFLSPDAAVSTQLCRHLVELLNTDRIPEIPRTGSGAAGEIIPLAHLGAAVTEFFRLGPKEGVAMLEGVPVTTALAALLARDTRRLRDRYLAVTAVGLVLVGANADPYQPAVARADAELAVVLARIGTLAGIPRPARLLQAPVSYRVAGVAMAHLDRALQAVDAAILRAVDGVTDSPAYLDGRFVGTAGFDGFDLAATLDGLRVAMIRLAEISAARLHRLLDDRITGLPRQLSAQAGLHAGMATVHKRAAGIVHALPVRPTVLGSIETSLGQEDVQSFPLEAAEACRSASTGLMDVLACELLAQVHAVRLASPDRLAGASAELTGLVESASAAVPPGTEDRPFGRDVTALVQLLSTE